MILFFNHAFTWGFSDARNEEKVAIKLQKGMKNNTM